MCFLLMNFAPVQKLFVNIHLSAYAFFIKVLVIGGIYTYTGSVLQYWRSCTPSQSIQLLLGSAGFMCWMPRVVFFGFTNNVFLYDNKTNTRMIVTIGVRFKQHFDTRYFVFCNLSPPSMFSLDLSSEYRIQHVTIGPFYVTCNTQLVLLHHMIFWFYLYILISIFFIFIKYSCTKLFHRRSLCTSYYVDTHGNTSNIIRMYLISIP